MVASGCAALTSSAAARASSASIVTWSALLPILIPTAYCMVMVAASSDRSHRAGDVLAQRVRLALDVVEPLLHHVADTDHSAQPAILLHHRNVTDAPVGHQRHERTHPVLARAGEHLLGHHAADTLAQDVDAVIGDGVEDVAIREDAGQVRAVLGDHERSDPLGTQAAERFSDRHVGPNGLHLAPLARQDVLDVHRTIPPRCTRYGLVPVCCSSSCRASHTRWSMASSPPAMLSPSDADRRSAS